MMGIDIMQFVVKVTFTLLVTSLLISHHTCAGIGCSKPDDIGSTSSISRLTPKHCDELSHLDNTENSICNDCIPHNEKTPAFKTSVYLEAQATMKKELPFIQVDNEFQKAKVSHAGTFNDVSALSYAGLKSLEACSMKKHFDVIRSECLAEGKNTIGNSDKYRGFLDELEAKYLHDYNNGNNKFEQSSKGLVDTTKRPKASCDVSDKVTRDIDSHSDMQGFIELANNVDLEKFEKHGVADNGDVSLEGKLFKKGTSFKGRNRKLTIKASNEHTVYSHIMSDPKLFKEFVKTIQNSKEDKTKALQKFLDEKVLDKKVKGNLVDKVEARCENYYSNLKKLMCADADLPVVSGDPGKLANTFESEGFKKLTDKMNKDFAKGGKVVDFEKNFIYSSAAFKENCEEKKKIREERVSPSLERYLKGNTDSKPDFFDIDNVKFSDSLADKFKQDADEYRLTENSLVEGLYASNQETVRENICDLYSGKLLGEDSLKKNKCDKKSSKVCRDIRAFIELTKDADGKTIDEKIKKAREEGNSELVNALLEGLRSGLNTDKKPLMEEYFNYEKPDAPKDEKPKDKEDEKPKDEEESDLPVPDEPVDDEVPKPIDPPDIDPEPTTEEDKDQRESYRKDEIVELQDQLIDVQKDTIKNLKDLNDKQKNEIRSLKDRPQVINNYINQILPDTRDNYVLPTKKVINTTLNNDETYIPNSDDSSLPFVTPQKGEGEVDKDKAEEEDIDQDSLSTVPLDQREDLPESGKLLEVKKGSDGSPLVRMNGVMGDNPSEFNFEQIFNNDKDKNRPDLIALAKLLYEDEDFVLKLHDFEFHITKDSDGGYFIKPLIPSQLKKRVIT